MNAGKEDIIRIAAFITYDLVIPLGPDFLGKTIDAIKNISEGDLSDNKLFQALRKYLPGSSVAEQKELIRANVDASGGFLTDFAQNKGIEQKSAIDRLRQYVEIADDKLDYVAATIDVMTDYYTHTGIQTVARRVVQRAYQEL